MFNWLSKRICVPLSAELFPLQSVPCLPCCMEIFSTGCRTLHLKFFSFLEFPLAYFSSLPRSSWTAALPSRLPTALLSLPYEISPVSLLRMHSLPSSRSSMKMLDGIGLWHLRNTTTLSWVSFRLQIVALFEQSSRFCTQFVVHPSSLYLPIMVTRKQVEMIYTHWSLLVYSQSIVPCQ